MNDTAYLTILNSNSKLKFAAGEITLAIFEGKKSVVVTLSFDAIGIADCACKAMLENSMLPKKTKM